MARSHASWSADSSGDNEVYGCGSEGSCSGKVRRSNSKPVITALLIAAVVTILAIAVGASDSTYNWVRGVTASSTVGGNVTGMTLFYMNNSGTTTAITNGTVYNFSASAMSVPANNSWANITLKPDLFSTSWANITEKPTLFNTDWNNITNKPSFNNSVANNSWANITNKPDLFATSWANITLKPDVMTAFFINQTGRSTSIRNGTVYNFTNVANNSWGNLTSKPAFNNTPLFSIDKYIVINGTKNNQSIWINTTILNETIEALEEETTIVNSDSTLAITFTNSSPLYQYRINATRRTIQTFMGNLIADQINAEKQRYETYQLGDEPCTVTNMPYFTFDWGELGLNWTYGEFSIPYYSDMEGSRFNYCRLALGVPFRAEEFANKGNLFVTFRMGTGSGIGDCMTNDPNASFRNMTLYVNRGYISPMNSTQLTFTVNQSFKNWTTLVLRNFSIDPTTTDTKSWQLSQNYRAGVVVSQFNASTGGVLMSACLDLESIVVEQYNG